MSAVDKVTAILLGSRVVGVGWVPGNHENSGYRTWVSGFPLLDATSQRGASSSSKPSSACVQSPAQQLMRRQTGHNGCRTCESFPYSEKRTCRGRGILQREDSRLRTQDIQWKLLVMEEGQTAFSGAVSQNAPTSQVERLEARPSARDASAIVV